MSLKARFKFECLTAKIADQRVLRFPARRYMIGVNKGIKGRLDYNS